MVRYKKEGIKVIDEKHRIIQPGSNVNMINELLVPSRKNSSITLVNKTAVYPIASVLPVHALQTATNVKTINTSIC